ncbi:MAG: DegT/DnrJ/EryC1/StrS family aminotransferase [Pseudomonadota bacterium]
MKTVTQKSDLAINGAPPAFEQFLHVGRPNVGNKEELLQALGDIVDRNWLTNDGPLVREFEGTVARFHNVKHCVAICNGTIALEIAIRALGLKGEVIVPSYTFIATAHALSWQGITPVFADIDPTTHNLDPAAVRSMITPNTTGIIGVHLWGRPAPVNELAQIAEEFDLKLMYDAAHAFGASLNGMKIGAFGKCEVLSFHATKVLNSFEGGAILTNDPELAQTAKLMRNFGFAGFDNVIHPGTNGKMTEICAAMGLTNFRYFSRFVESNRSAYQRYAEALRNVPGIRLLEYDNDNHPNYHYIVVEIEKGGEARDKVIEALHAENVLARKYFWPGCHGMQTYKSIYPHAGLLLQHTNRIADRVIVLPNGASLPEGAEACISDIIRVVLAN